MKKSRSKKRYQNRKHLEWVVEQPCTLNAYTGGCYSAIQAHHLLKPIYSLRGMGLRAGDRDVIPLCMDCHRNLHKRGNEIEFFYELTGNGDWGKQQCQRLWLRSPFNEDS